jgi:hypothetical protein
MISGSRIEARKITATIGTPRQNSMKITEIMRMTGSSIAPEREQDAERDRDQPA